MIMCFIQFTLIAAPADPCLSAYRLRFIFLHKKMATLSLADRKCCLKNFTIFTTPALSFTPEITSPPPLTIFPHGHKDFTTIATSTFWLSFFRFACPGCLFSCGIKTTSPSFTFLRRGLKELTSSAAPTIFSIIRSHSCFDMKYHEK